MKTQRLAILSLGLLAAAPFLSAGLAGCSCDQAMPPATCGMDGTPVDQGRRR